MANQSPMISIPKKTTEEVDWTTPIRSLIAHSYGESPDNYAAECAALQRCRQDAVRGAGSDTTARDLLYKYFGQLELLELRFSEIKVNFPWRDAFTNKLTTQTSIAFEKASILFQIAGTHSAIAASQSRSDPEGLKRAFYYFKTCAGMLTYINENFLHAPSTDLSREVIKFLVSLILAQATEVFFEKCTDEKKGIVLVSKVGAQAASMYNSLTEEVKEFMGKGIFDRNWVTLLQVKAKYFTSLSQYYRGMADNTAGKHGDALVRFNLAESLAKDASRTASSLFTSTMSPTLPADASTALQDRMKAHLAICSDRKSEAQRENDLIYNAVLPAPEALPAIDKIVVANPIPIQEVYGTPEVQKTIGQDLFLRLVPLSVHESASVYSEEKAKLVRSEVEKVEGAEGEVRSVLDGLGIKDGLTRFRAMAEGEVGGEDEIPVDVRRWKDDISLIEEREGVETLMAQISQLKNGVQQQLETTSQELDTESRNCEMMRVKYEHLWTQEPSGGVGKTYRQDLKSHFTTLDAAAPSDQQVAMMWQSVKSDIGLLLSPQLEDVFRASTEHGGNGSENLLDFDPNEGSDAQERAKIGNFVTEIEERTGRLNKIARERNEVLKDLKEKVQNDDVSHLLLLNRRNTGVEPALFAAELEKFRPYQQRLEATLQHQAIALQEITTLWKSLKDLAGRGPGARKWEEREKRKKDTVRRFSRARDVYMEVRDGLAKGLQFYNDLTGLTKSLHENVNSFIFSRVAEKDNLVSQIEVEKRLSSVSSQRPPLAPKPPLPPPSKSEDLSSAFSSMSMRGSSPTPADRSWQNMSSSPRQSYSPSSYSFSTSSYPPPPPSSTYTSSPPPPLPSLSKLSPLPPPPPPPSQLSSSSYLPPPPPQPRQSYSSSPPTQQNDPYANLGVFGVSTPSAPLRPPPPGQYQTSTPSRQMSIPPASQLQYQNPSQWMPPPPAPLSYQTGNNQQQQQYQGFPPPSQPYGYLPPGQGSYGR
ncbi:BRO1-domain-containing protein [Desarmillaria tabescens]|uniref:BRO domain-containing protein 1 n=1 Tax=Armillaria tabescens TaxID=1929756 RepID=A0AA39NPN4_ARMTA|nr:BRO1-domain-containing protein [Desarmillaria tabescens]KAK0469268.1 BRO1-domain-containing protein [Desarmillaria tabescens]